MGLKSASRQIYIPEILDGMYSKKEETYRQIVLMEDYKQYKPRAVFDYG